MKKIISSNTQNKPNIPISITDEKSVAHVNIDTGNTNARVTFITDIPNDSTFVGPYLIPYLDKQKGTVQSCLAKIFANMDSAREYVRSNPLAYGGECLAVLPKKPCPCDGNYPNVYRILPTHGNSLAYS